MIQLEHISKRFGRRLAVQDLSLEVPRGEIYGLLGHNGAGKSTAIGIMLGQVWPSGGRVRICGHEVTRDRGRALSKVGAIFESPAFYDYLSGWRNLEILSSYTRPTPPGRIREIIEWVGLSGREHSKVRTYSHGMRARLALAQTLLPEPELLILDEPSDGLDPEGIHEMRQTILRLHREMGLTILLSSHFLNEVEQLCGRIAVLSQGKKVFEGSLAETRHRESRVRLDTPDFAGAAGQLRAAGLIRDAVPDGNILLLNGGVETHQVVRFLVERGFAVNGIAREQRTLEDFYLSLMETERGGKRPVGGAAAWPAN
ncbi:MAG TPA: ABC transporter ATP-binding protein [Candidatus Paceibacterota bacterium]|nr:ABC transporter ATP-binding protein [Candidatus Paceibacterota bacterium]